ncbi:MAG TPA: hypothetical protein VMT52_11330 [Planctomycetota bacterium]|nr:hypothetical protein [Planctomycetota bacterium]
MKRSLLLGALTVLTGCAPKEAPPPPAPSWAYEKTFSGGPVSLVLRLDRAEATLADRLTLEQELQVEPGFEAEFPEYLPEDFEGFAVTNIAASRGDSGSAAGSKGAAEAAAGPDRGIAGDAGAGDAPASDAPADDARPRSLRKRLTLEPERSGQLTIAPLAVYFHRSGQSEESSFLTEEVPVEVKGIEDIDSLTLADPRGILESPPEERSSSRATAVVLAAAGLLLIAGTVVVLRRRRSTAPPPEVPPHEVAYDALRRLVAMGLIEKGQVELFFVHLSAILREYIERRFHVRAPERTTEEFLDEATRDPALAQHRARLGRFLSLCDQVKFARHDPDEDSIQAAFDTLKQFLVETIPAGPVETPTRAAS